MNKRVRNILYLAILALLAVGFTSTAMLSREKRSGKKCHSVLVTIEESYRFITEEEISRRLSDRYGECTGVHIDSLRLDLIERIVDSEGAVKKSQAFISDDGVLHISVTQRDPYVRFQNGNKGFYADREGYIFPLQDHFTPMVTVIDGDIPVKVAEGYKGKAEKEDDREWIDSILAMLDYMRGTVWEKNIVQIHVDSRGELILVPREGREKFVFGKAGDFKEKFRRMENYYGYIKPSKEEGRYAKVDVRFDGQIICK